MFGFGEAKKVRKLRDDVKGMTLAEVVEKYGDARAVSAPEIPYDADLANEMTEHVKEVGDEDIEVAINMVQEFCSKKGLDDSAVLMYVASKSFSALRWYSIDLAAAATLVPDSDFPDYFFSTWLKDVPFVTVLPIMFPPQNSGKIEEFRISRDKRYGLIDNFFGKLKSTDNFTKLVNSYVSEHPYFRIYPNV